MDIRFRSGIVRPRPAGRPHPHRKLPRLRGVVRCSKVWGHGAYSYRPHDWQARLTGTMRRRSRTLLLLAAALAAGPALAEVLAEGKVKGGYYWQKVSASNGTRYLCRSTTDGRIQKAAACTAAGAVKP